MSQETKKVRYSDVFWLFMLGNLIGVLLEGIFCHFVHGHWETHTVTIWGPFCLIYGIGIIVIYIVAVKLRDKNLLIQFIAFAVAADVVEFSCGLLLEYGLHMIAWDYSDAFLNIKGYICLKITLGWGLLGVLFARFALPRVEKVLDKMQGKLWKISCAVLSVFMAVNIFATSLCMVRWKTRHEGKPAENRIEQLIDQTYNDEVMQERFVEWRFR